MNGSISDTVLNMVLALANKEQNQHYPPSVYELHYQLATNYLINECVKRYPGSNSIMDLIQPYTKSKLVVVTGGEIDFPLDYRNILGFGIYLTKDKQNICSSDDLSTSPTDAELAEIIAAKKNVSKDLELVSIGRWNDLTNSSYKQPELDDAIACIFGKRKFRICPYNVPMAEVRYVVKTPDFVYGYSMNPDDTYFFDATKTTEALWEENAIEYLVKACNLLFASYLRDPEGKSYANDLRDSGLF